MTAICVVSLIHVGDKVGVHLMGESVDIVGHVEGLREGSRIATGATGQA